MNTLLPLLMFWSGLALMALVVRRYRLVVRRAALYRDFSATYVLLRDLFADSSLDAVPPVALRRCDVPPWIDKVYGVERAWCPSDKDDYRVVYSPKCGLAVVPCEKLSPGDCAGIKKLAIEVYGV